MDCEAAIWAAAPFSDKKKKNEKMKNLNPNQEKSQSQCQKILEALQRGETLTPIDALRRFGCFRLTSRICDLKQRGVKIEKRWRTLKNGKMVMSYRLQKEEGV